MSQSAFNRYFKERKKKNAKTKVKRRKDIQFLCRAIVFVSSGRKSEVRRHERELKKKKKSREDNSKDISM